MLCPNDGTTCIGAGPAVEAGVSSVSLRSHGKNEKSDKVVGLHDPDARWGFHGIVFAGYKLDVNMDADSHIITAVNVLPGNGDDVADTATLIRQEEQTHGNDVQALSIDSIGFDGPLLRELTDPQDLNLEVFVPPKNDTPPAYFTCEQFTLNESGDRSTCPAGQTAQNHYRNPSDNGWIFRFPRSACESCPLRPQCLEELPKHGGRAVFKHDYEAELRAARATAKTPEFAAARRQHWVIERKLAEMVRWHGGRRARYRGRAKVLAQSLMTAIVVNVKRVLQLLTTQRVRAALAADG